MAEEQKQPTVRVRQAKLEDQNRIHTERYRRVYTNNMLMEFSKWDVSLIFGEILEGKGDVHTIEEIEHLTMSHSFAKTIASVLSQNIAAFEKQFGEIKVPEIEMLIEQVVERAPEDTPLEPE